MTGIDMLDKPSLELRHRDRLSDLADVLFPHAEGMPAASEIDLANAPLDKALRARPDLLAPLLTILDDTRDQPPGKVIPFLASEQPSAFDDLMQVVAGAYYMNRQVRDLLHYDGQRALSLPRSGFGAEDLLMELMESPPRYVDPALPTSLHSRVSAIDDK